MTEEMQIIYERLSFCFETRKFADLRILLLDMEPADIALYMEDNLDEKEQIKIVKEKADSFDIPVVITGDLNATDEDPSIKTLSDGGYTDSRYAAPITDDSGTYNGYEEGRDDYERIDYIFFNGGFEVTKYDVVDGIFASDHFAIYSDLEFAEDIA